MAEEEGKADAVAETTTVATESKFKKVVKAIIAGAIGVLIGMAGMKFGWTSTETDAVKTVVTAKVNGTEVDAEKAATAKQVVSETVKTEIQKAAAKVSGSTTTTTATEAAK